MSELVSKNENNKIEVTKNKRNRESKTEIDITSVKAMKVYDMVRDILSQLMASEGRWEGNIHKNVMVLVKELIEFTESYKFLSGKDKKVLAMLLLKEIFEKELILADFDENVKSSILSGIDNVVEPALELALYAAKGNIQLNKKKLWKMCFSLCK